MLSFPMALFLKKKEPFINSSSFLFQLIMTKMDMQKGSWLTKLYFITLTVGYHNGQLTSYIYHPL